MRDELETASDMEAERMRALRPQFGNELDALKMRVLAQTTTASPKVADRYVLGKVLGTGASGTVFEARDTELERKVAVKLVDARTDSVASRVVREAQVLAQLSHPNVVQVFEVGMPKSGARAPHVVMELVVGVTLRQWLEDPTRSTSEILGAVVQAARGLHAAHRVGIVHRDFKPDNILIGRDGRVRVVDFGLARPELESIPSTGLVDLSASYSADRTATGEFVGTPAYMAPEAFAGEATAASDQYSLCLVLYEALVGQRPHDCRTLEELVEQRREAEIVVPRTGKIPRRVAKAIRRGLSRNPEHRFPDVAALIAALEGGLGRRSVVFASGGAAVVAAAFMLSQPEDPGCVTGQATWEDLEDLSEVRDVLRQPLTRHIDTWISTERELCDAADGELEGPVRECLAARVAEAQALVEAGRELDLLDHGSVARAMEPLGDPAQCGESPGAPAMSPTERTAAVELAQQKIERLRDLCDRSENKAASPLAQELLADAREIDFAPLLVEAASLAAHVSLVSTDYDSARDHYEECFFTAKDAAMDWWAATCASAQVMVTGEYLRDSAQSRVWAKRAAAGYERTGSNALEEINYVQAVLRVARREGDFVEQERLARAGLEIVMNLRPEHRRPDKMLSYIGEALAGQGKHEDAVATLSEAAKIRAELYGVESLGRAEVLDQLGDSLFALSRYEDALERHTEGLRIRENGLPPGDVLLAESHKRLALVLAELGRGQEAQQNARRGVSLISEHYGDDSAPAAEAYRVLGDVLVKVGPEHRDEALVAYRRALVLFSLDHPDLVQQVEKRIEALQAG